MGLHVECAGEGPPLVLLHGWALHAGLWGSLMPQLAATHRVHMVDLPGHGWSPMIEPYSLEAMAYELEAHFSGESEPLRVLGWSLGGMVAMCWALLHPRRVERLVLMCTTPRFVQDEDWPHALEARTLERFGDELRVDYHSTLARFLSLQVKGSERGRASLARLRERLFERGEPALAALDGGLRLLSRADLRARVAGLAQLSMVIAGGRDRLTPWAAAQWLAERAPNARLALIEAAAHAPFLSHPQAFHEALRVGLARG